jgi:hypothetical protein
MPFTPLETLSDAEFDIILTKVALWITKLPKELPDCTEADTAFKEFLAPFHPDTDYLEKTGCKCAATTDVLAWLGLKAMTLAWPEGALALLYLRPSQSHQPWLGPGLAWCV